MKTMSLLQEALAIPAKDPLFENVETIKALRAKKYSWRDIADFLSERGIETDHTKIFRFMKNWESGTSQFLLFKVPSKDAYINYFIENPPSPKQKKMLVCHYLAHNRTVTFTELAAAAEYPDYKSANLQYGKLGRSIGEELGMVFARFSKTGDPFYSSAIGMDNPFRDESKEYELVMHHELAKAIETIKWA